AACLSGVLPRLLGRMLFDLHRRTSVAVAAMVEIARSARRALADPGAGLAATLTPPLLALATLGFAASRGAEVDAPFVRAFALPYDEGAWQLGRMFAGWCVVAAATAALVMRPGWRPFSRMVLLNASLAA